ncbi:MAG: GNAT family N-acetyltransferase [Candidatus Poseidoniaceae archaeon]|tara:strand:- start:6 stop:479 length:474 start_codon:yes stop_codon:yes gene_type:complete
MEIRALQISDSSSIWEINEQGLPGTGKVSEQEILDLLNYSSLSIGLFDSNSLLGFVICLPPKTAYGSLNYLWFNERYDDFLYVDRIAVSTANRNQKIGSKLYQAVTDTASKLGVPIAAEVNLRPPNPDSVRFHQRHGFTEIGQFEHGQKAVIMMLKQ